MPEIVQLLASPGIYSYKAVAQGTNPDWMDPGWFTFVGLGQDVGADVDVLSHEVNEWVNDPFLTNVVPDWSYSVPPIIRAVSM